MRLAAILVALFAISSCANQQYAGINYGEVTTPDGEQWKIAGGKDETNVSFKVNRADGTTVEYTAENANGAAVLAEMAKIQAQQLDILTGLLLKVPAAAP